VIETVIFAFRNHRPISRQHDRGDQRRGSAQAHPSRTGVFGPRCASMTISRLR